jgi:hypothetical protein
MTPVFIKDCWESATVRGELRLFEPAEYTSERRVLADPRWFTRLCLLLDPCETSVTGSFRQSKINEF